MHLNVATTVSCAAAATCLSLSALGGYLGRSSSSRHFRYAAAAGMSAALYCLTNAVIAGETSAALAVWAGRVGLLVAPVHGAMWLLFLAAWDRRPLTRMERTVIGGSLVLSLGALVPGWGVLDTTTQRTVAWLSVTYNDPDAGPLASPIMLPAYAVQVMAALAALRMTRRNPRALAVGATLGLYCLVIPFDWMSALHVLDLPYFVDPALALAFCSIGIVVVSDASESAAKSAELERARVALAERENLAALGQLAAVVAHEVRNPVAIILGALTTLQRAPRTEEDAKLLGIVGEEAERLKQLVTRMLDAVRPFVLQHSVRPARDIVSAAIAQATAGAGVASAEVVLESAPPDEVECDEILLGQAVSNLVENALVASGRRGPVRVRVSVETPRPAMLRIEVTDDGDGIPLAVRPRLFTPFFTTRATGTGLGLALVKRIAGAHGGTIDFETPASGGASFVLRVPLHATDASPRRLLGADVQ